MKLVKEFSFEEIEACKFGYHPFARPKMIAHIYYVDGLLIDTGQSRMRPEVLRKVKRWPIEQIFITHHHEDHSGNVKEISDHFNCPVYGSQLCSEIMKNPPAISRAQNVVWGDRPAFHDIKPINSVLKTRNYEFELIPVPGHAIDMVALYEPNKRWLFSSDLYVHYYISYFLKGESMAQQIESIKTILTLDFDVLLCGHNPQFELGKAKLQKKLEFFEEFYSKVAGFYKAGMNSKQIFKAFKLKENWPIRLLSMGNLSKMNMVDSVIEDVRGLDC